MTRYLVEYLVEAPMGRLDPASTHVEADDAAGAIEAARAANLREDLTERGLMRARGVFNWASAVADPLGGPAGDDPDGDADDVPDDQPDYPTGGLWGDA